tara:strand:- start:3341 stop:3493 length:153 start_codon:yes stop_codon:yes gene_type:complete
MNGWYERYLELEKENAILRKEIAQMQDSMQKSYIRIKELREELDAKDRNS